MKQQETGANKRNGEGVPRLELGHLCQALHTPKGKEIHKKSASEENFCPWLQLPPPDLISSLFNHRS